MRSCCPLLHVMTWGGVQRIRDKDRPDEAFTTDRAVRAGRANASSGRIMVTVPGDHFGPIPPEHDPRGLVRALLSPTACADARHCSTRKGCAALRQPLGLQFVTVCRAAAMRHSCSAGHPRGGVLEGPPGLPPVGSPLPPRGRHRWPVQPGRPVCGPLWRVQPPSAKYLLHRVGIECLALGGSTACSRLSGTCACASRPTQCWNGVQV